MTRDHLTAAGGIVFAAATFAGLMLLVGGVAAGDTPTAAAAAWTADSAHRTRMLIGAYVMSAGIIAFVVFAASLLQRMRAAEAPPLAISVAQFAAVAFAVLALASAVGMASGAYAVASDVEPRPIDPGALRTTTLGFALWAIPAALAGATFVASVSAASLASGALPRWLTLIGFLLSVVALFGITFLPTLGLLAWALLVALVTLVRGQAAAPLPQQHSPA